MKRVSAPLILALVAASTIISSRCLAQRVRNLTGSNLTSPNLVHVLTPKGMHPRGLGLKPDCTELQKKTSRGIELPPKADIAAIPIEFAFNSSELTPEAQKALDTVGQALDNATLKPCCFQIQGYTDSIGSDEYNQKLSEARAESVINYLADHEQIERDRTMPKGFGKSHPLVSNKTDEGRQKNRRVQIVYDGGPTS